MNVKIAPGTYPARVTGYTVQFQVNGVSYTAQGKNGVRGINVQDTVKVTDTSVESTRIGPVKWVMVYCDNRGYVGVVYQYHGTRNEFLTEQRCTAAGHQMVFVGQSVFCHNVLPSHTILPLII